MSSTALPLHAALPGVVFRRLRRLLVVGVASAICATAALADLIVAAHPNHSAAATGQLFLFGAPGGTGAVSALNGFAATFTLDSTGMATVNVPSSQFLSPAGSVSQKSLRVSGTPVAGYLLNHESGSADMSYVFDDSVLGSEYRVLAYPALVGFRQQMSISAAASGTVVTITPTVPLDSGQPAGAPFSVTLAAGESILYQTTGDMTGTRIAASQPVAVFAGASCAQVPVGATFCDHLYSQLPAVTQYSSHYILPETANTGGAGNLVRVLANTDGTVVSVNGAPVATLNAGQFHEIASAGSVEITASQPVLVGQFLKSQSLTGGKGDPAFSIVPGVDQSLAEYVFAAPVGTTAFTENFVNVAIPTASLGTLTLNGAPVPTASFAPLAGTAYSVGHVAVIPGKGSIEADAPFVATLSGFKYVTSYHTLMGASYARGVSPLPDLFPEIPSSGGGAVGTTVNMQIAVSNMGSGNSTDGVLDMALPAGLALDLASLPPGCGASTITQLHCTLAPMMPGAPMQLFNLTLNALAAGTWNVQAVVSGVSGETNLVNNTASAAITVLPPPTPDLSVAVVPAAPGAVVGATLGVTVNVSNAGPGGSTGGVLDMAVPAGLALDLTILPAGCGASTATQLHCTLADLAPGASQSFGISLKALASGTRTLQATVSGVVGEPATALANNTSSAVTVTVSAAPVGPGGPGGGARPVPVDAWWMLLAMASGIGVLARRHAGRRP